MGLVMRICYNCFKLIAIFWNRCLVEREEDLPGGDIEANVQDDVPAAGKQPDIPVTSIPAVPFKKVLITNAWITLLTALS